MHPYYEKNRRKLRKQMNSFLSLIAPELEKDIGKPYTALLEEVWQVYDAQMLERFPYIGGDGSSGTRNLTGAYCYVALGVVCRQYGMTLERWGYLVTLSYRRFFEKIPKFVRKLPGHLLAHPGLATRMLQKKDRANAKNSAQNPGAFQTKVQPATAEYAVIYHTKVCPLADFARKYGYLEFMPYICNLDYVSFGLFGLPFYREKTCAAGDGVCDFKFSRNAPIVPDWPCHSADPEDPLK